MASITVRVDDIAKEQSEQLLKEMGLTFTSAFNLFLKQMIRERGIPFKVTTKPDVFYSDSNINHLLQVKRDAEKGVNFSEHELIEE